MVLGDSDGQRGRGHRAFCVPFWALSSERAVHLPIQGWGGSLRPPGMRSIVGQAHFTQQSGLVSGLVAAELRDVGWLGRED